MCPLGTVNVFCFTNKDKQIGLGLHVYSIVKCSFIPCLIVTSGACPGFLKGGGVQYLLVP